MRFRPAKNAEPLRGGIGGRGRPDGAPVALRYDRRQAPLFLQYLALPWIEVGAPFIRLWQRFPKGPPDTLAAEQVLTLGETIAIFLRLPRVSYGFDHELSGQRHADEADVMLHTPSLATPAPGKSGTVETMPDSMPHRSVTMFRFPTSGCTALSIRAASPSWNPSMTSGLSIPIPNALGIPHQAA